MILGRIIKFFKSLRFTIALLISLLAVFFIGVIVPQKDLIGERLYYTWRASRPGLVYYLELMGFTDIYSSPITLALWALFFLNLAAVMSARIPLIWKKTLRVDIPQNAEALKGARHYESVEGVSLEQVTSDVKSVGFRFFTQGSALYAVRNRLSPLGTILFHLSFFLLLVGGVMTFYTKFGADVIVAVGETFEGNFPKARPPRFGSVPKTTFKLLDVKPTYFRKNLPVGLDVVIETINGRKVMGVNRPYNEGATSVVFMNLDVAPLFVLEGPKGTELDGAYVKLNVLNGEEDSFRMEGYEFSTFFYTDIDSALKGEELKGTAQLPQALKQFPGASRSVQPLEIVNPAFKVTALKKGEELGFAVLRPGERMEFDGGHTLRFEDLTYWVKFYIVKEHGLGIVYAGFVLMCAALTVRFGFYRRELRGFVQGGTLHLSGRAEFFPALFSDEFERIVKAISNSDSMVPPSG